MKPGDLVAWDKENHTQGFIKSVYHGTHNPLVGEELMADVYWFASVERGLTTPQVLAHPASFLYLLSEGEE